MKGGEESSDGEWGNDDQKSIGSDARSSHLVGNHLRGAAIIANVGRREINRSRYLPWYSFQRNRGRGGWWASSVVGKCSGGSKQSSQQSFVDQLDGLFWQPLT